MYTFRKSKHSVKLHANVNYIIIHHLSCNKNSLSSVLDNLSFTIRKIKMYNRDLFVILICVLKKNTFI